MKKLLFAGVLLLAVLVPVSLLGAQEVVDSFLPPGCDSFTGFSATTGEPCKTKTTPTNLPPGCTSNVGYSATTGEPCKVPTTPTNLPPGCTSTAGYSATTGEPCKVPTTPTNLPPGCTSTSGYSATTGEPCGTTTTISPPTIPTTPTTFPTTPTTTPTTDSPISFIRNLTVGSRGTDVTELQELLRGQGLLNAEPTGYFGTLTKEAVRDFQRTRGISDTGYVGTLTRGALTNLNLANSNDDAFLPPPGDPRVPTPPLSTPATPTGLIVTPSSTQVNLNWNAVTGATAYRVYRGTNATDLALVISPDTTGTTQTGLVAGTTYYYAVSAFNASGESAKSAVVSATVPNTPTTLFAPTGLTATPATDRINLSWNAVAGATGYKLYRGTSGRVSDLSLLDSPSGTSFTNTSVVAGTTYYYSVSAYNSSRESFRSAIVSATYTGPTPPAVPTGLTVTPNSATNQMIVRWNAVTGANGYHVYKGTSSVTLTPQGAYATREVMFSATPGTTYYFAVSAYNAAGESAKTTPVSATQPPYTGEVPTGGVTVTLRALPESITAGDLVRLEWTASSNVMQCHYGTEGGTDVFPVQAGTYFGLSGSI